MEANKSFKGKIDNWAIVWWPRANAYVVIGECNDHPIRTSEVTAFVPGSAVVTKNSTYTLGYHDRAKAIALIESMGYVVKDGEIAS